MALAALDARLKAEISEIIRSEVEAQFPRLVRRQHAELDRPSAKPEEDQRSDGAAIPSRPWPGATRQAATPHSTGSGASSSTDTNSASSAGNQRSMEPSVEEALLEDDDAGLHVFREWLWDATVLLGLPTISVTSSITIALGLFVNFAIGAFFSWLVYNRFFGQPPIGYPPYHYGNSQGPPSHPAFNTNTSAIHHGVARIIAADPMAITLILLLALIYRQQVQPVFSLATALSGLPKGKTELEENIDGHVLKSINPWRLLFVLMAALTRMIATIALVCGSMLRLTRSVTLESVLASVAALGFIISSSETLAEKATPTEVGLVLQNMKPLPYPIHRTWLMLCVAVVAMAAAVFCLIAAGNLLSKGWQTA